ncbi:MAG: FixH family protein [Flavobacteriales bacterium]
MNWGWKITIFLTCFITFILSMVVYSFYTTNDLVAEDYYNQEIHYQQNIDAQKNALPFAKDVTVKGDSKEILVSFPENFDLEIEQGDISFYRPDNAKLDKSFDLKLTQNNTQSLKKTEIISGQYKVTIQFISGDKTYIIKKDIWV